MADGTQSTRRVNLHTQHTSAWSNVSTVIPDEKHQPLTGLLRGFGGMPNCASSGTATDANVNNASSVLIAGFGMLTTVCLI